MRTKGMLGPFFGRHAGIPGLSKSVGNDLSPGAPLSAPVWEVLPDVIISIGQPIPFDLKDHCNGTPTITYVQASGTLPAGVTLNADGTFTGNTSNGYSGFPTFKATNSHGNATSAVPNPQWSVS